MTPHPAKPAHWDFLIEDIEFYLETMELRRERHRLRLEPRMFDLLRYLLNHRDRVVKKEELFRAVWDGTAVCDGALTQCVSVLRKALGDTGRAQRFLRTYPRVGYRFVGRVESRVSESDSVSSERFPATQLTTGAEL